MKPDLKNSGKEERRRVRGPLWFVAGGIVAVVIVFAFPKIHDALQGAKKTAVGKAQTLREQASKAPASASVPNFDFYELLKHPTQILTPEESGEIKAPPATRAVTRPGSYVLQVSSLRDPKDAERLKAQLALWGIDAHVQTVRVQGAIWHRVRVGPIQELSALNALREKLAAHELQPLLIRVGN